MCVVAFIRADLHPQGFQPHIPTIETRFGYSRHGHNKRPGPYGHGNARSGRISAPSLGYEPGKQEPLCMPAGDAKRGVRPSSTVGGNAICWASGLRQKCTDGHSEKPIAQTP